MKINHYQFKFKKNPEDILEFLSKHNNLQRPKLVIGFSAETKNNIKTMQQKKKSKKTL